MKKLYFLILTVIFVRLFAYTNTYADWYGVCLTEPSHGARYFAQISEKEIDLFDKLLACYTFEYNANPRQPSVLTSGFTYYSTIKSILPSTFKYRVNGFDYNLSAKLFGIRLGNSSAETIIGFGGAIGLNLETIELFLGSSNSSTDFKNVDFKHFNSVHFLNIIGTLRASIEVPLNFHNFPVLAYIFNYHIGITVFGPFLPNFESVSSANFEKTFSIFSHNISIKLKF
ncbi:MAG: hypothetical protein N2Z58_06705 [Fervidobacterium sp.]|nr:hypothetical protein [Fervidobacterium sp.]